MRSVAPSWLRAPWAAPTFRVKNRHGSRPDIVLFLSDEQRYDEVGYASGGHFETPVLDGLAERGVVFDAAYSAATVCVPARTALLTGLQHHRVPTQVNNLALREGYWTIARGLKAVGYETALVGKAHFAPMEAKHGFDTLKLAENLAPFSGYGPGEVDDYHRWLLWKGRADHSATHLFGPGLEGAESEFTSNLFAVKFPHDKALHPINWIADTAIDLLRGRKEGAPLFLVVSFPRPHAPYDPAEPYASLYDPADARIPSDGVEVNAGLPDAFREAFQIREGQFFNPMPRTHVSDEVFRRVRTYVRALVRQIDDAMGDVVRELDLARTVLFFTSDHGTYAGHRGMTSKVPWIPFDDLARVPFVCSAPGARPGTRVGPPVQSCDFALTCLDYAGIDPPPGIFDTVSLRPLIEGRPAPEDRRVFSATTMGWPMVRSRNLKLIRTGWTEVLFDLDHDPGETTDVSADPAYAPRLAALRVALNEQLARPIPSLNCPS